MNYTEFMNAMLCEIRGQVDAQVRTELYTVTKNNGTRRTGILFKQEDSNLAPTIYLEEFYQKYLKGQQVPDLADSICSIYQEIRVKKTCDCQNLFDFNHVKEHIVYKLIRRDANEELLKQIPYEPFLDLAVVYYIQIDNTRFGSRSATSICGTGVWKRKKSAVLPRRIHRGSIRCRSGRLCALCMWRRTSSAVWGQQ